MERVLWVDDDPNFLYLVTRTLQKRFALETSTRAEEALQWIADGRSFGVIISDMRMPGMDGRAFLRRLNELGIPVATRLSRILAGYKASRGSAQRMFRSTGWSTTLGRLERRRRHPQRGLVVVLVSVVYRREDGGRLPMPVCGLA
jgi:CheY-like chemotaxis protein